MLGLPKSTEINTPLPKKEIFHRFSPKPEARRLFDDQINRMTIVAEISPQTMALKAGAGVTAIYVVQVTLKTPECDKKNIALLSQINQRMLFVLVHEDIAQLAVYRADTVFLSERKPLAEWTLPLSGLDLETVWENTIARIGNIDLDGEKDLDAAIAEKLRREKLQKQIAILEAKAMKERQPRKKWELAEEIQRLKSGGASHSGGRSSPTAHSGEAVEKKKED
ncbi:MAG: DUF4391 domain-containing protein [Planctomycetia bacterium]|nr:DUF4391 domain-containing protein [Planctomycetia bacterium]